MTDHETPSVWTVGKSIPYTCLRYANRLGPTASHPIKPIHLPRRCACNGGAAPCG